ncbi:hypothetical protein AALA54_14775 [Oscillospiraceae bacterium 44-34]
MMNRTQNYNLCQWEAADKVQRTDFNEDNRKIEAAILAARKAPCCVYGTYVGNGGTVTVDVGFRPGFLVIIPGTYSDTALTANGVCIFGGPERQVRMSKTRNGAAQYVTFTENGFQLTENDPRSGMTATDVTFHYYAFY